MSTAVASPPQCAVAGSVKASADCPALPADAASQGQNLSKKREITPCHLLPDGMSRSHSVVTLKEHTAPWSCLVFSMSVWLFAGGRVAQCHPPGLSGCLCRRSSKKPKK